MYFELRDVLLILSGAANLAWAIFIVVLFGFKKQIKDLTDNLKDLALNIATLNEAMSGLEDRTTRLEDIENDKGRK